MANSMIELRTPSAMPAYVAEPAGAPRGGMIVIQEIFGVSQPMKNAADLLAAEGYLAVVPAMFHRVERNFVAEYNDEGMARGIDAMKKTTVEDVTADLSAAAAYLRERLGEGAKVGVWGFCLGGTLAFLAATLPFVDASVSFYGGGIANPQIPGFGALVERTNEIRVPMLLAFGEDDHGIAPDAVAKIRAALEAANKDFELDTYAGAGHGFFRPGPESSDAAALAWARVKAFLAAKLV